MKNIPDNNHFPFGLLLDQGNQLEGLGLGADDYITKPFDINLLILRIKSIVV